MELQVKGLENELTGVIENKSDIQTNPIQREYVDNYDSVEVSTGLPEDTAADMDEGNLQLKTINELDLQIDKMIENYKDMWRCKICGKTASKNHFIRRHAEIHIEGMSHGCHICNKTFTNRNNLRTHIYRNHSK